MHQAVSYVLITPARNEAAFIEQTIQAMIAQTALPLKWVIVSDGSTDGTDEIVKTYVNQHAWIELIRTPERKERHFAGKVHAFNAGYEKVKNISYEIIGSLDADITFEPDYMAFLLRKFAENPKLGVAGTPFREGNTQYDYRFTNIEHVSGACQLFRKKCFEDIGGYTPLKVGGIDLVAVTTARMKGWETRTFTEMSSEHHRKMGTAMHNGLMIRFRGGYHDYLMGMDFFWILFRAVYQMRKRPVIVGGAYLFAGYLWALLKRAKQPVSNEFVAFRKMEQRKRLKSFLYHFPSISASLFNKNS
jgi:glycosyltransferase involved in cell wall biosynthesis